MKRLPLAFLTAPFETCICLILVVTQAWALIVREPPSAVLATLPVWLWRGYEGVTLFGALLVVIAVMLTDRLTAETFERAGLWMLFTSFAVFAFVILRVAGLSAILGAGTYLALALACVLRIYAIRKVRRLIDETHE